MIVKTVIAELLLLLQPMLKTQIALLIVALALFTSCYKSEEADVIIRNANIVSMNNDSSVYEAMAIKDGKIIELGKENQILNKYQADEIIDAKTASILPGFYDAHCHFLGYGLSKMQLELYGVLSMEEIVKACQDYHQTNPEEWIVGRGWDNTDWKDQSFPNNELLNSAFPNTPVLLRRIDGHGALANQKALELAGITDTTYISGGHIEILEGKLTGMLMDNAVDRILDIIPEASINKKKEAILRAQKDCLEYGLTTVSDAGLKKDEALLLQEMEEDGLLKIRVYVMLSDNQDNFDYFLDSIGHPIETERVNIRGFKFYGDGSLGSRSACLTKPYYDVNDTVTYGFMLKEADYFRKMAKRIVKTDFQMCTHCIGDSAARTLLNIYGEVLGGYNDKRWRIEHAQVINPEDFHLFADYTIIPSVQPTHATSDMLWAVNRLGDKRLKDSYAYNKLMMQNYLIALGTDFPIENISPIETYYAAVARKNLEGNPKNGFQIENALSRWDAMMGMTFWAAMASFEESHKGSLEVGKDADFVILSQDILGIPEEMILDTYVKSTYILGKKVYGE